MLRVIARRYSAANDALVAPWKSAASFMRTNVEILREVVRLDSDLAPLVRARKSEDTAPMLWGFCMQLAGDAIAAKLAGPPPRTVREYHLALLRSREALRLLDPFEEVVAKVFGFRPLPLAGDAAADAVRAMMEELRGAELRSHARGLLSDRQLSGDARSRLLILRINRTREDVMRRFGARHSEKHRLAAWLCFMRAYHDVSAAPENAALVADYWKHHQALFKIIDDAPA